MVRGRFVSVAGWCLTVNEWVYRATYTSLLPSPTPNVGSVYHAKTRLSLLFFLSLFDPQSEGQCAWIWNEHSFVYGIFCDEPFGANLRPERTRGANNVRYSMGPESIDVNGMLLAFVASNFSNS